MEEIPLAGGNTTTGVVRVGDTVRRPAGPQTPAVHAFLTHLRAAGFVEAPRPLGLDEQGREVLEYVEGSPAFPEPVAELGEIGRMIRRFHDAAASFTPPADACWQVAIPDPGEPELVVHHDLAPWNVVRGDRWYLVDWDSAGPGTRLWDLAYAAHGFVPLAPDAADPAQRLRTLVDAYGLDEPERLRLLELLPARTQSMVDLLDDGARTGREPWATLARTGHRDTWARHTSYIQEHAALWRTTLLS
jgi:Ser/Thr protein kinase RdoA (MazF antagonist)